MEEDKLRLLKLYNMQDLNFPQTFDTFLNFSKRFLAGFLAVYFEATKRLTCQQDAR